MVSNTKIKPKKTSQYRTSFTNTKTSHVPKRITTHHRPEKKSQKREQEERGGERGRKTKDYIHTHEKEKTKNSTPLLSLLRNAETDLPVDTPPQPSQTPEVLQIQETPRAENADSKHLGSEGKGGQGWGQKKGAKHTTESARATHKRLQQCKAQIQELEQDPSEAKRRARGQETQDKQQKGPESAKRARKKKRNQAEIRNKQQRTSLLSLSLPLLSRLLSCCTAVPFPFSPSFSCSLFLVPLFSVPLIRFPCSPFSVSFW
jgi:hypothetical protein